MHIQLETTTLTMKLKLRDIVLDHHPAYVAMDYALGETLTKMVRDLAGTEELHEKELDVQLLIDGKEYDLKNFFQLFQTIILNI